MKNMEKENPKSLITNLQFSFVLIIALLLVPTIYSIIIFRYHTSRYDRIILNVTEANNFSQIAKKDLDSELWNAVSGLTQISESRHYILLHDIRTGINEMKKTADSANIEILEVAERTERTLEKYVQQLDEQVSKRDSVAKNQELLEQIRGITSLLSDILQEYIIAEIESAESANKNIRRASATLFLIQVLISLFTVVIAMWTSSNLVKTIRRPIKDLEYLSYKIAGGDLSVRTEEPRVIEFEHLAVNMNRMAEQIKSLIEQNVEEQKNLQKAEMKTLQAQITPHFLYNTFDTIIWLAEEDETEEVIEVTKAFSSFFRISLSRGHEWITLSQEIEHVTSYLKIQRVRYRNILEYEINCDDGIGETPILKLLLQPLVENAIYHGIKNKRGRGKIIVRAEKINSAGKKEQIRLSVKDNGIGFKPERLEEVIQEIRSRKKSEDLKSVYGLYNVSKRLELYYGSNVRLNIQSEYGSGTEVWFEIPLMAEKSEVESV